MTTVEIDAVAPAVVRPAQGAGRRSWGPSVFLATAVGAVLLATPTVTQYEHGKSGTSYTSIGGFAQADYTSMTWTWFQPGLLLGVLVVGAVVLARRRPVLATGIALLPFLTVPLNDDRLFPQGWWLGLVAIAMLAALDGRRNALVPFLAATTVLAMWCFGGWVAVLPAGPSPVAYTVVNAWLLFGAWFTIQVVAVGAFAGAGVVWRARIRSRDAAVIEQHALEVESLAGERARLARDLHDVVAHHVSLVAVRAESAPYVHPGLDDTARGVLAAIATDAREALTELRQVLVVLQRTDHSDDRTPQPTACDVDQLVVSAVAAGQPIEVVGTWRDISAANGYVLYRAVQEGLTNARRHAPGTTTRLVRRQDDGGVGFSLSNPAERADEPGRGLIGMRERVEALGGTFGTQVVDGTFVLDIWLTA
ncbi:sensor histidine kinase [Cellulomonas sp. URHD0024]|uniref:sensor histidine kinase n=1 Tax=Cellulomonas sp. URHD0024 TaxID=1302620 RepID=UPI0004271D0D|nr:histidine kinase [Cellulomonas sp. URHD0024]